MTRKLALGAGVAILIILTAAWRIGPRVQAQAVDPCVGKANSVECLSYRLDRVDRQLGQIEALIGLLQQRPAGGFAPGPPVSMPLDPGRMTDASNAYLQQRIDALSTTVSALVNRVNAVR